jgi:serine/threonine protein kinase
MKRIGKYEVIGEIGTGSMGTIYRARDQVLDRAVALKMLRTDTQIDPELKERFYREARACARLAHPNIITVYDMGEAEGVIYIAMELLSGSDLRKLLQENRPMDMTLKVDLMAQVCDGLEHAHGQQLVHRDIKPSNIFYCDDQRAKILDFGIARTPLSNLTIVGKVLGSPNYMAPEQIRGAKCDSRSDLFSAAIVFCEFLVRAHPFQDEFIPKRIVGSPPDSLREKDSAVPEALEVLLRRSLEKDPDKRIQTAAELAAGLRSVLRRMRGEQTDPSSFPAPVPELRTLPPDDAADQRLSEFLRLVGGFDEGIEKHNIAATRAALEQMGRLAATDGRFSLAVSDCQSRFNQMTAAAPSVAPPVSPKSAVVLPAPKPTTRIPRTWLAIGAGVIVLIGMAALVRARSHTVPPAPVKPVSSPIAAVATARVAVPSTDLIAAPNPAGQRLATLPQSQVVKVIEIPNGNDREYTKVRADSGPVGFVRTMDLADWSGVGAEPSFSILKLFAPGETASAADLVAQLDKWNQFIANFPGAPQIAEAYLQSARLRLELVKRAKSEGKPAAEWQPNLDLAKEALSRVSQSPTLAAEAAQLLQQTQSSSTTQADASPEQILRHRVPSLYIEGKYTDAIALVDQILAASPNHAKALYWKKRLRAAQEAEAQ